MSGGGDDGLPDVGDGEGFRVTALYLKLLACERLHIPPVAGTFDDQPPGVQALLIQYARLRERLEA